MCCAVLCCVVLCCVVLCCVVLFVVSYVVHVHVCSRGEHECIAGFFRGVEGGIPP